MKAIGYIRISTKDQSHFSIQGQTEYITRYCQQHNYELLNSYVDDGKSAKDFDRPDWKKLELFVKNNKVDYLIVMKYDRFSRNLLEALQKIELLETKYNIRIISVNEPIAVHPQSPYYFKMRADILTGAQTEWLIIRDRTKFGINTAQKSGRYLNKAPFGYLNQRDANNKSIIVIDELKAPIIRRMYNLFIQGESTYKIGIWAKSEGFNLKGKSAVIRVLTNPTYAGLVKINQYYDDNEKLIKGIHEAIISEDLFNRVQNILNFSNKRERTILNDEVPLRAKLLCYCGRPLTGAPSKGKSKYYWYYKCNTHYQINLNANKLNTQIQDVFNNLSLTDNRVSYIKKAVEKKLKECELNSGTQLAEKQRLLNKANKDIESLELKYLRNEFEYEAYFKWKTMLNAEKFNLENQITSLRAMPAMKYDIDSLATMGTIYKIADTIGKQKLVSTVFNNSLYYFDNLYRTPYLLEMFRSKALILKEKRLLEYEQPLTTLEDFPVSSPKETSIEHYLELFQLLYEIKNSA